MRKRRWLLPGCLAFWLLVTPLAAFVIVRIGTSGGKGSLSEAVRLRPAVEAMASPEETFLDSDKQIHGILFPNGEWVVGVAKDSYNLFANCNGGGTVVLKDRRGRVRCIFGEVLGRGNLMEASGAKSLDEFDAAMANHFTEQQWP